MDTIEPTANASPNNGAGNTTNNNPETTSKRAPSQATTLLKLSTGARLFHSWDGIIFADIQIDGHRETWAIKSTGFRRWLRRKFYLATGGKTPSADAMTQAVEMLDARAALEGARMDVHVRIARVGDAVFIDLGDEDWAVIEIDADGWRFASSPPVRFRRAGGMLPLPMPLPGGNIALLRGFLNLGRDSDFKLVVAWLQAAIAGSYPYPLLTLAGEQGTGKSTAAKVLKYLVDPTTPPARRLPRNEDDLFIAAENAHILSFDNLSGLPDWMSDALASLATGGGFAARMLYSNSEERRIEAQKPIILNGIEDVATRPDLADRAILLTLEPIPDEHREPEGAYNVRFAKARPYILGGLLDTVSAGLRKLPDVHLPRLPRMADFAQFGVACDGGNTGEGSFWQAYAGNRAEAVELSIASSAVATAITDLMTKQDEWGGTATALLDALNAITSEAARRAREWPNTAKGMGSKLRRQAATLRKAGIDIQIGERKGHAKERIITIRKSP